MLLLNIYNVDNIYHVDCTNSIFSLLQGHVFQLIVYAILTIITVVLSILSCNWGRQLKEQFMISTIINAHAPVTMIKQQQPNTVVPVASMVQMTAPAPVAYAQADATAMA
jgi:hypothetical protein